MLSGTICTKFQVCMVLSSLLGNRRVITVNWGNLGGAFFSVLLGKGEPIFFLHRSPWLYRKVFILFGTYLFLEFEKNLLMLPQDVQATPVYGNFQNPNGSNSSFDKMRVRSLFFKQPGTSQYLCLNNCCVCYCVFSVCIGRNLDLMYVL